MKSSTFGPRPNGRYLSSEMQKEKRSLSCVHVRHKNVKEVSRCSRSTTAKKSTKKRDACAKSRLLLCLSKSLWAFLPFSLPSPKLSFPGCFESRVWTTENYCWGVLTITQLVEPSCTPAPGAFIYREHWAQRERKSASGLPFFPALWFCTSPLSERLDKQCHGKALLTHSTSSTVKS